VRSFEDPQPAAKLLPKQLGNILWESGGPRLACYRNNRNRALRTQLYVGVLLVTWDCHGCVELASILIEGIGGLSHECCR
jgi:hypothetical protein